MLNRVRCRMKIKWNHFKIEEEDEWRRFWVSNQFFALLRWLHRGTKRHYDVIASTNVWCWCSKNVILTSNYEILAMRYFVSWGWRVPIIRRKSFFYYNFDILQHNQRNKHNKTREWGVISSRQQYQQSS